MYYFSAVILGIIQGFTEFLPVSSSGHLVIAQKIIPSLSGPGIILEVVLHAGTLLAVLYYFRDDIVKLNNKYYLNILIATIPAAVIGIFFNERIELLFDSLKIVGLALFLTAAFNYLIDELSGEESKVDYKQGFLIGIFQALAIIPGISRSGSTIFASRRTGISKQESARFSFLLSIPAILGANVLEFTSMENIANVEFLPLIIGFIAAFLSGLLAIKMTIRFLKRGSFKYFAFYTAVLGLIVILI